MMISIIEMCLLEVEHEFLHYRYKQNRLTGHAPDWDVQIARRQIPLRQNAGSHNLWVPTQVLTQSLSDVHATAAAWCDAKSAANTVIKADSFMSISPLRGSWPGVFTFAFRAPAPRLLYCAIERRFLLRFLTVVQFFTSYLPPIHTFTNCHINLKLNTITVKAEKLAGTIRQRVTRS